jgi:general stress protein 26
MNSNSLSEIRLLLAAQELPVAFLATVDDAGKPRVRPISLMSTPQGFYIATSRKSRKSVQIVNHSEVEWVTLFPTDAGTGYLRLFGKAKEVHGEEKSRTIEETQYPVRTYWNGVDDPDFIVFRIDPLRVEFIRPGDNDAIDVTHDFTKTHTAKANSH